VLFVNGSTTSPTTVNANGTLAVAGTITSTVAVNAGGELVGGGVADLGGNLADGHRCVPMRRDRTDPEMREHDEEREGSGRKAHKAGDRPGLNGGGRSCHAVVAPIWPALCTGGGRWRSPRTDKRKSWLKIVCKGLSSLVRGLA